MDKSTRLKRKLPHSWEKALALPAIQDSLFLTLIVSISVFNYVGNLGFYLDDWDFLSRLNALQDHSLLGLVSSFYTSLSPMWPRPVQAGYLALLYWMFGLQPIGYHVVNSAVLISGVLLIYWVLRELGQNRWITLSIPLVYALLPHYSTDRFWYAAFQANLSMALYFSSLYCDLRILKAPSQHLWGWKLLGLCSLLGSSLAYEVFMPLLLLVNPLLTLYKKRQLNNSSQGLQLNQGKLLLLLATNLIALALVVIFKKTVSARASSFSLFGLWIIKQAVLAPLALNFGEYGIKLPQVLWTIVFSYQSASIFILSGVVSIIIFIYFYRLSNHSKIELPEKGDLLKLASFGLVVSSLSYAYFNHFFKVTAGLNNRVSIAAAVGVALTFVGGFGWVSNLLSSSYLRKRFFALMITLFCSSGFLINNINASFWTTAYQHQQDIIAALREQYPAMPVGSTVLLDGFCPYVGSGVVFETNWDVTGMLRLNFHNKDLTGDVVKPNLQIRNDGISLRSYGMDSHYPYKQLYVYNFDRKMMYQFKDADSARRYFMKFNPSFGSHCKAWQEGVGVKIF